MTGFSLVFTVFWASFGLIGYVLPLYLDTVRQVGGINAQLASIGLQVFQFVERLEEAHLDGAILFCIGELTGMACIPLAGCGIRQKHTD